MYPIQKAYQELNTPTAQIKSPAQVHVLKSTCSDVTLAEGANSVFKCTPAIHP